MSGRPILLRSVVGLIVVSTVCVGVTAVTSAKVLDIIGGLALLAYLPGAALILALDGKSRHLGIIERHMWAIAASLGLSVAGGLVLNLAGGLTRESWLIWTSCVIAVSVAVAVYRIGIRPDDDGEPDPHAATRVSVHERLRLSVRQGSLLFAAFVVCSAALALSIHSDAASSRESFVQAWVLPQPVDNVSSPNVQVGLLNHLGETQTFIVTVTVGRKPATQFSVDLTDGASWRHRISRQPGEQVESSVATAARPSIILSRVYLATPVS